MNQCAHIDGEFCDQCWPPKSKNTKTAISMFMHISRVDEKIYVALDANPHDLKEFGISMEEFGELGDSIKSAVQFVIEPLSDRCIEESKL